MHQVDLSKTRKTFHYISTELPIFMIPEAEINKGKSSTQRYALLDLHAALETGVVNNRATGGSILKSHWDRSAFVYLKASGRVKSILHGNVPRRHSF